MSMGETSSAFLCPYVCLTSVLWTCILRKREGERRKIYRDQIVVGGGSDVVRRTMRVITDH